MDVFAEGFARRLSSTHVIVYAPSLFARSIQPAPHERDSAQIDDLLDNFLWPLVRDGKLTHPIMNRVRRKPDAPILPYRIIACPLSSEDFPFGFVASFRTHAQSEFTAENLAVLSAAVPEAKQFLQERIDAATGLLSRAAFESEVVRRCRPHSTACVVYANLDQIHVVNELAGFTAGDHIIRDVGLLWRSDLLATGGIASHLSGDRFAAVLVGHTLNQARAWAEKIRESISRLGSGVAQTPVSASLGVASLQDAESLQHALAAAETACRVAKDRGRDRVELYATGDQTVMRRHGEVRESRVVIEALDKERFVLHAQPIVALDDAGTPHHHELLLRLRGDDGKLSSIAGFIAAAERYQLLERVDRWVVSHAVAQLAPAAAALRARGASFTVNLTGQSIGQPDFADFVRAEIRRHGIPPGLLDFEITETAAIRNPKATRRFIARMTEVGARMALDDFGTGLSSLIHLKDLDAYRIKIDGQFVRDVLTNARSRALIRALVQIAREIGMETVAEFVETAEIAASVKDLGVQFAQGYFYGRPRPFSDTLSAALGTASAREGAVAAGR